MAKRWSFWAGARDHRSIRWLDDQYQGLLAPMGQVLVWVIFAGCLLQVLDGTTLRFNGAFGLIVLMIAFAVSSIFAALVVGFAFRPQLVLTRRMPAPPAAGEVVAYRVLVENRGLSTARQITVQERSLPAELSHVGEPPFIDSLAPGESREVTLRLMCPARGAYQLKRVQGASAFPAAIWKWPARRGLRLPSAERLLVVPRMTVLDRLSVPLGRQYQPGGFAAASRIGDSTEFLGTRDWRQGDRIRDLHWPSFARTGRPIVKEFQEEYFVRVALVIDTEVRTSKEEALFERGLSFAAGAAQALAREDAIIDLVAAGSKVHRIHAGRALAHVEQILETLACVELAYSIDTAAVEELLLPEVAQLSAVILIFVRWTTARGRLVQALRERGVAVRVLVLRSDTPPEGLAPDELLVLP